MSPRNKKKIYGGVVGLSVLALGVDKLFLSGGVVPAEALGAYESTMAGRAGGAADDAASAAAVPIPELPFPRSLPPFEPAMDRRDLCAVPEAIAALLADAAQEAEKNDPAAPPPPTAAEAFAAAHRLQAMISYGVDGTVVVDGKRLQAGDTLDDCELIQVDRCGASFQCHDGPARLPVLPITHDCR